MRKIFVAVSVLMLLAVLVQFYLAGIGAFDRPHDDGSFAPHRLVGMAVIPLLSVLATVTAALARAPGRLIGMAIAPFGLAVVQSLIVEVGNAIAGGEDANTSAGVLVLLGLHVLNALLILGTSAHVVRGARALAAAEPRPDAVPVA